MVLLGITLGIIALVASSYLWFKPLFQPKALNSDAIHDVFVRKNPDLDTDRYRPVFFFVGLFFTLLVTFFFFDIKLDELIKIINKVDIEKIEEEIEEIAIEFKEEEPIKTIEKPAPIVIAPKIEVVSDDKKVTNADVLDNDSTKTDEFNKVDGTTVAGNKDIDIDPNDKVNPDLVVEDNELYDDDFIEDASPSVNVQNYIFSKLQANKQISHGYWKPKGVVYIQFVIEKDGSVSSVKTTRTVSSVSDKEFYELLETTINSLPNWAPATKKNAKGNIVKVRRQFVYPISFQK